MKRFRPSIVLLLVTVAASATTSASAQPLPSVDSLYSKAGVIRITDPLALEVGSAEPGQDVFAITLWDVYKFTGHVCGGVASGFLLTKEALEKLFPDDTPDRGRLKVRASRSDCFLDPILLITGTRAPLDGSTGDHSEFVIDKSLAAGKGEVVILFERTDKKRKVKAVWSRKKMFSTLEDKERFVSLKEKVEAKTATREESEAFGAMVQQIVAAMINGANKPFTVEVIQ